MLRKYSVAVGALAAAFGLGLYVGTSEIVAAKSNRLWEIRTYTTAEGKLDSLVKRMGEHEKRMFEKHGMKTELFSVAADAPQSQNTFIYILSHDNREAAKKSWDGLRNDPEFKTLIENSGRPTIKAEWIFVTPTDYSPLN
jgi:hypothetical protein